MPICQIIQIIFIGSILFVAIGWMVAVCVARRR